MKQRLRSSGFFVELIITIVFFAIACSIIVRIFVVAGLASREAYDARNAAVQAQTLCEMLKAQPDAREALKTVPAQALAQQENVYTVYYDKDWQYTNPESAVVSVVVSLGKNPRLGGELTGFNLRAQKGSEVLYTMDAAQYFPGNSEVQ